MTLPSDKSSVVLLCKVAGAGVSFEVRCCHELDKPQRVNRCMYVQVHSQR